MEDIDGMVGWLMELMEDAHIATGKSGGGKDGIAEIVLGHHLRTGEGEENAARTNLLEGLEIKTGITLQCIVKGTTVLGKCRGVEDDEVVVATGTVEILEGILAEGFMTTVVVEVETDIASGQFDGLGTAVNGMDQTGAATHGIEGETAGIAEHVEDALATGKMFEK